MRQAADRLGGVILGCLGVRFAATLVAKVLPALVVLWVLLFVASFVFSGPRR